MVKLVYCLRKRADVSAGDFYKYWLEQHGPLVHRYAQAIQARKYVQSHTILAEVNEMLRQSRDLAAPYDGITEVWWDGVDALTAGMATAAGQAAQRALIEDERKFIDHPQSRVFMTEEHAIF